MGHTVNPIAFRMGWASNWIDSFFVDRKYYPQYLHMLFRLRLFLHFIFKQRWFEGKGGFFYSHFLLTKDYNSLALRVFFYDGKTEQFFHRIEDYVRDDRMHFLVNSNPGNWHERKTETFFTFYIFFIFFRLFHEFYIVMQWSKLLLQHRHIERIAKAFFNFDKRVMRSALQLRRSPQSLGEVNVLGSIKRSEGAHFRFFYFYLLCRQLALVQEGTHVRMKLAPVELAHRFTFLYTVLLANNFIFSTVRPYLTFLMTYLTFGPVKGFQDIVQLHFLAITNENVTATMIARYIALKLRQGFTPRGLLYPLKREYNRLLRQDRTAKKPVYLPFAFLLQRVSQRNYFSALFRSALLKLSLLYCQLRYAQWLAVKNTLTFDGFLFLADIALRYGAQETKVLRWSLKYFLHYFFFAFFHYHRILLYYQFFLRLLFRKAGRLQYRAKLRGLTPLAFFPQIVPKIIFNSFENHSDSEGPLFASYKFSLLRLFLHSFRRKMHILYSEQSHHFLARVALAKNRLLRLHEPSLPRRLGFRGFKIQCLGRFTRKQRSAKLTWAHRGVPLSTISAKVDYSTFSVVLINSSINVKVWFYKDEGFVDHFLKIL